MGPTGCTVHHSWTTRSGDSLVTPASSHVLHVQWYSQHIGRYSQIGVIIWTTVRTPQQLDRNVPWCDTYRMCTFAQWQWDSSSIDSSRDQDWWALWELYCVHQISLASKQALVWNVHPHERDHKSNIEERFLYQAEIFDAIRFASVHRQHSKSRRRLTQMERCLHISCWSEPPQDSRIRS